MRADRLQVGVPTGKSLMSLLEHARRMAAYNRWMNERLYALCASLSEEERRRDMGAFFRSVHGTLNHLLLADRVWMGRFLGEPFAVDSLDQQLCADFVTLPRCARGRPGRRQLRGSGSPRAPGWWRDPGSAAARSRAPWRWARERRRAGKSKLLSSSSVTCLSSRAPTGGRARRRSRGDGSSPSGGNARCREARPRGIPVPPGRRARRARVPLPRER